MIVDSGKAKKLPENVMDDADEEHWYGASGLVQEMENEGDSLTSHEDHVPSVEMHDN